MIKSVLSLTQLSGLTDGGGAPIAHAMKHAKIVILIMAISLSAFLKLCAVYILFHQVCLAALFADI